MSIHAGTQETIHVVPEFTMPGVGAAGPMHFYAALFTEGSLAVGSLISNVAGVECSIYSGGPKPKGTVSTEPMKSNVAGRVIAP